MFPRLRPGAPSAHGPVVATSRDATAIAVKGAAAVGLRARLSGNTCREQRGERLVAMVPILSNASQAGSELHPTLLQVQSGTPVIRPTPCSAHRGVADAAVARLKRRNPLMVVSFCRRLPTGSPSSQPIRVRFLLAVALRQIGRPDRRGRRGPTSCLTAPVRRVVRDCRNP